VQRYVASLLEAFHPRRLAHRRRWPPTDAARRPKSPTDARAKEQQERERCEVEVWVRGEEERRQEERQHVGPRREWALGAACSGEFGAVRRYPSAALGLRIAETSLLLPNPGFASSRRPIRRRWPPRWGSMSRPPPWGSASRPLLRSSAPSHLPARSKLPPVHKELPLAHSPSPPTTLASPWPSLVPLVLRINCCLS
jgi:hypothetical protein